MKWTDIANYVAPILGIVIPRARTLIPALLQAINEAQRMFPDTDETREQKRAHVFAAVLAFVNGERAGAGAPIGLGDVIAAIQTIFQAIDAIHAIAKAQQAAEAPAPATTK